MTSPRRPGIADPSQNVDARSRKNTTENLRGDIGPVGSLADGGPPAGRSRSPYRGSRRGVGAARRPNRAEDCEGHG